MRGASSLRPTSVGDNQAKRQERKNECSRPRSLHSKRKQHVFEELDDGVKEEASQKCGWRERNRGSTSFALRVFVFLSS